MEAEDVRYWLGVHGTIVDDADESASETDLCLTGDSAVRFCDEIAAQHEKETLERLAEWEESGRETEDQLIQEVAARQAKVAVMEGALQAVREAWDDLPVNAVATDEFHDAIEQTDQALSTEPQVLWRKRGTIHHSSDPPGYWYVEMGSAKDQTLDSFDLLEPTGVHGEEVDVFVLSHQGSEQDAEAE